MYSTCLFCNSNLGANEVIQRFPLGRRLAFDAAKGRLWVVCRHCERWNLTPLEERWEAIEECERQFHDTRLRVSTDNIGLARLREGLELVRIGEPQRPEFAAWRFGDQFGRRRRRHLIVVGSAVVGGAALIAGGMAAGLFTAGAFQVFYQGGRGLRHFYRNQRLIARVPDESGKIVAVRAKHLSATHILPSDSEEGWMVRIVHADGTTELSGKHALRATSVLLAGVNRAGAAPPQVREAVDRIDRSGGPQRFLVDTAHRYSALRGRKYQKEHGGLQSVTVPDKLALEMAVHEETERRAMEGELRFLEAAWKDAEEIAGISDNLLLPASVESWLRARG